MTQPNKSPHDQMTELDTDGIPYQVDFQMVGNRNDYAWQVLEHNETWLHVTHAGIERWLRWEHIVWLHIEVLP